MEIDVQFRRMYARSQLPEYTMRSGLIIHCGYSKRIFGSEDHDMF
jgi:hypothetical protein